MRTDRRSTLGAISSLAMLLGIALATAVGAAVMAQDQGQGQEAPEAQEAKPAEPVVEAQEPTPKRSGGRLRGVPQLRGETQDGEAMENEPGGLRLPPEAPPEDLANPPAADPLVPAGGAARRPHAAAPAADPNMPIVPQWPFRYELTIASFDGAPLAVRYYPSQLGASAPVVLMVHDLGPGRSSQDFDAAIADLENQGLATHLQELGYAVMALDLRAHGQSPARSRGGGGGGGAGGGAGAAGNSPANVLNRWVGDLQAAYRFLLDRHNRRELNLAKFGVVALGDGANLASAWAAAPGGAVSIEGRTSDLAALVLISPRPTLAERPIEPAISALAPRMPVLLQAGAGDAASAKLLDDLRPVVERNRLSRITLTETRLPATNLLRFAPEATSPLIEFLDGTVKIRADEWEPRYNLDPVLYTNVRVTNLGAEPAEAGTEPAPSPAPPRPPAPGDAEAEAEEGAAADPAGRGRG